MKPNYHVFLIAILLSTLSGCKEQKSQTDNNQNIIRADLDKMDEISIHDLFDKIEVIPLETTDESLMKGCQKIICYNDKYFIHDGDKILTFDDKGRFLWKIDDRGQGPQEYYFIVDFDIDRAKNNLVILASANSSLFKYNPDDGSFLERQRFPDEILYRCQEFKFINNDIIALWTSYFDNRLKLYSRDSSQIFKECMPGRHLNFGLNSAFSSCNNNYFRKEAHNDIYEIMQDGKVSVAYTLDFGDLNVDIEKIEDVKLDSREAVISFREKLFASEILNYFFLTLGSNSDYVYTQVVRKNKYISVLYNKNDRKVSVFEKTKEGLFFYPIYWTDEFVVGYIRDYLPFVEKDLEKIIPNAILDAENIEKKKSRDEFDNPFLIKYYFKK